MDIELKKCIKCSGEFPINNEWFPWRNNNMSFNNTCKVCVAKLNKIYRDKNKEQIIKKGKAYYKKNKKLIAQKKKVYREENKELIAQKFKIYYKENKKSFSAYSKVYRKKNKKRLAQKTKIYLKENKKLIAQKAKSYRKGKIKYNSPVFKRLSWMNKTHKNKDGYGEIACAYCGKWIIPTMDQVCHHVKAINSKKNNKMNRIYCSESCKQACPTYNQRLWPKGFKKASSREVNPLIRQMCFEYDDYECQKCGATQEDDQLHCHHIKGAVKEPLLANDIDNVVTFCKKCHKWIHSQIDCGYADYKRPQCVEA